MGQRNSPTTYSHTEDCLRSVRRFRLTRSLDTTFSLDRSIASQLYFLPPLFGLAQEKEVAATPLTSHIRLLIAAEHTAIHLLLLLRRAAALSTQQTAHLYSLAEQYRTMEKELRDLDAAFVEFKQYFVLPGFQKNLPIPANAGTVPRNPVAWSEEMRVMVEAHVERWTSQRHVVQRVRGLLEAGCEAMAVSEGAFDDGDGDEEGVDGG
ncbi:hypothetical protein GMOD_00005906 [Pyrenophora seminiperda CCB06]|uniref:Uncharacterized protein n=1 Tax=Pyrenophora seminiperda CCB06 TaxID=1302712 RepID=A0A3M7MA08_9PLEO|nr:hypothetical protein GMOD_00005906 [Pyrenophora seminiperda CCB06]